MRRLTLAIGGALATVAALTLTPAATAQETGTVYLVHGIPNTPVDVYVDGQRAIDDFEPGTSQGPVQLPAGGHQVALFAADAPNSAGSPMLSANTDLPTSGNVTLVAHLSELGQPTITSFVNDVASVPLGQARLVVRHTAAAPGIDVLAGGSLLISELTNLSEKSRHVHAGTMSTALAAAGTTEPLIEPADLNLSEGTATLVHANRSPSDQSLALVVVTVSDLHSAPSGVPPLEPSGPERPAEADSSGSCDVCLLAATADRHWQEQ